VLRIVGPPGRRLNVVAAPRASYESLAVRYGCPRPDQHPAIPQRHGPRQPDTWHARAST